MGRECPGVLYVGGGLGLNVLVLEREFLELFIILKCFGAMTWLPLSGCSGIRLLGVYDSRES